MSLIIPSKPKNISQPRGKGFDCLHDKYLGLSALTSIALGAMTRKRKIDE